MLSISLPMHGVGHANYYLELAQKDYYLAEGNEAGQWFGRGAEKLGLQGEVESQVFGNLLWGRSPDGQQALVQNAGDPDRQTGWDLTFSAPKSVSVLWSQSSEAVRHEIVACHRRAVETALNFLEETTGLTRRGQGGKRLESADLTFATFLHYSSRGLNPQLHTHAVLVNLAVRRDGTTGALWSEEFFRSKLAGGAIYQVQLAAELQDRLGLRVEPASIGFQIAGVSREVCRASSQRRQEIEAKLAEVGRQDAQSAKWAALVTRPAKPETRRGELLAAWRAFGAEYGWNEARVNSLLHQVQRPSCDPNILEQRFRELGAELPPEKRSRGRLFGLAAASAVEHGADAKIFRPLLALLPPAHAEPRTRQEHQRDPMRSPGQSTTRLTPEQTVETTGLHGRPHQNESSARSQTQHPNAASEKPAQEPGVSKPGEKESSASQQAQAEGSQAQTRSEADPSGNSSARSQTQLPDAASEKPAQEPGVSKPGEKESSTGQPAQAERSQAQTQSEARHSGKERKRTSQSSGKNSTDSKQQRSQTTQSRHEESHRQRASRTRQKNGKGEHGQSRQTQRHTQANYQEHRGVLRGLLKDLDPRGVRSVRGRKKLYRVWQRAMRSGDAEELFSKPPLGVPRQQQRQNHKFKHAFEDKLVQIPPASQTRRFLRFHAIKLAVEHKVTPRAVYEVLRDLRPATERGLISVEWRRLFPKAPSWSPVKYWKAPAIVLGRPAKQWGKSLWQKKILGLELRLQKRYLVPKSPHWSPLYHLSLPALRVRLNKDSSRQADPLAELEEKKSQDKSQSQSL